MAAEPEAITSVLENSRDGVDYEVLPPRIKEALLAVNNKLDLFYDNHFLGGSYRFGWATEHSDIDIMVYAPTERVEQEQVPDVHHLIYGLGATICNKDLNYPFSILLQTEYFGIKVHLSVTTDINRFDSLFRQHKIVSVLVYKYPILCDLMRLVRMSGAQKFRALLRVASDYRVKAI